MDSLLRDQIEKGTRIAFMQHIIRCSSFGDCLQIDCPKVISSTIKSIENDPEFIAEMKDTKAGTVLEKIIKAAEEQLPEVINSLESDSKLVNQEK